MYTCSLLVLVLSALALPREHGRDLLGLLDGDSDAPSTSPSPDPTRVVPHAPKLFTGSYATKPTLATSTQSLQWTPTPTAQTDAAKTTPTKTALASTSILSASLDSHASKTWQIIGIVVIAVLFVATSVACAMFFDRLCRFLKDVICCTSGPLVSEEFVPDCEKQCWDTRSLPDRNNYKAEYPYEAASADTVRPRELPWNDDTNNCNTLHRHPSQRNDHS